MKPGNFIPLAASLFLLPLASCTKQGPAGPKGTDGSANVQSVTFTNVTVPLNGTYTFQIPAITQAILDSGTVNVYYKGGQAQDTWYPLPQYYFFNGNLVWMILSDIQLGQATLSDNGITAVPFTSRFDITAAN
ncbi:MAG TPA: hypothetical protein VGR89_07410 [Puia sp.]|nr:hypothetical protein [Puia sp.]